MAPAGVPNRPDWELGERKKEFKPWSPFPSLSSSSAVVLKKGGDLAQVETFYSPQKGPGNCTRPLPSAAGAEILAVRTVLGAWERDQVTRTLGDGDTKEARHIAFVYAMLNLTTVQSAWLGILNSSGTGSRGAQNTHAWEEAGRGYPMR